VHLQLQLGGQSCAAKNIRRTCVQEEVLGSGWGRGKAIIDMRSALGTVSGSKAPLTTVHAKLEAIVVRARRHQYVRQTTSKQGRAPRGSGMQQQWYLVSGYARVEDAGWL
jgi:hypothetical protein